MKQMLGYISKIDLELNPQLTDKFKFVECPFTRKMSNRSDRIYSKKFYPFDYDEVAMNTKMIKDSPNMMLVKEPCISR